MGSTSAGEQSWYALYTRPRFEKKVDLGLKQKNLHSFLPLRTETRLWSNGKRKVKEPIFPSYVFVHIGKKQFYSALQTYGVCRFVKFNGSPVSIPEAQIQSIHCILEHGYIPEPYVYLRHGDLVEIARGPLNGLRGFYVEDRGVNRLVISVDAIMQSICVEAKRDQVKLILPAEKLANKYQNPLKYLRHLS